MLVLPSRILESFLLAAISTLVSPDPNVILANTIDTSKFIDTGTSVNMLVASASLITTQTYNLANGPVTLSNPLQIFITNKHGTWKQETIQLRDPTLLGSGGGGAVFGYSVVPQENQPSSIPNVAVKISWSGSSDSVRNECHILQVLEERGVSTGVEKCVASLDYPFDDSNRAMIVMEPVVGRSVSNVMDLPTQELRTRAVDQLIRIMAQMMAAGVVTTDVQPLISTETGYVLLIDMTEAKVISSPPSFVDLALATSFTSEVWNLIPDGMTELASQSFLSEWKLLEKSNKHLRLSPGIIQILQEQPLLSVETADYIGRYISSQSHQ